MKAKTLCGFVGILIVVWAGAVLAQSVNQAVNLAKEAKSIFDSAKSKEDYQRAAQKYEEALKISERVKSDKWTDICSYQLGGIQSRLGQYQKSLEYYEKSLAISKKIGDVEGEGKSLSNMGGVYRGLFQYTKALDYYEQSLAIRKRIGDVEGEGTTLGNIGAVYRSWGQYTKALDYYGKSLMIRKKIGDVKGESTTLGNIGFVCYSLGQYAKALDYYEQSLAIRKRIGDVEGEAATLSDIGCVYRNLGEYTKAKNYLERSLAIKKNVGDVSGEGVTLNGIGVVYDSLGQYTKAMDCLEQSLAIRRKTGNISGEGATLRNMARIDAATGRYDEAERRFKQSIEIQEKLGIPAGSLEDDLANLYLDAGATAKAEPLIYETRHDSTLGRLALIKFDYPSAQKYYEAEAAKAERTGDTDTLFRSYTGLARAYEGAENYSNAEEYYEKAMKLVEEIGFGLLPSERKNFIEVKIGGFSRSDPAKGLTRVRMKLNRPTGSVDSSEVTRARAFSDHLSETSSSGSSGVPKQTREKEPSHVNKLAALKIECKTKRQTVLILDVIDVGYPKPLYLVKDMTDSDIQYLFESRIKDKNYVGIPEDADIEVTERGKRISMVTFAYHIKGYVVNEDLICGK